MTDRAYDIRHEGHEFVIPFSLIVGFYDDPVAAARDNGDAIPGDVDMYAASFTHDDPDDPDDATLYFPQDPSIAVIAHEVVHAVTGIFHRNEIPMPGHTDPIETQELLAHTIGEMVELIVGARDKGSDSVPPCTQTPGSSGQGNKHPGHML